MSLDNVAVVARYRSSNTYGLHTVLGALETLPDKYYPDAIHLSADVRQLIDHIQFSLRTHDKVLVLWSFYSPDFVQAQAELSEVRSTCMDQRIIHIAGGVHATAEPAATLKAGFDYVATGDGEVTATAVLRALRDNGSLHAVEGLAFLQADGTLHRVGTAHRPELDMFPPFAQRLGKFNPIEITRGCIYACKFCQTPFMFKARFRHRSVANVRRHVEVMAERGLRDIRFITPTSLSYGSAGTEVNLEAIESLLSNVTEALDGRGRIFFGSFPSELRPEHVTVPALKLIKKYVANDNVIIGAQSGSESILASSKRGHGVDAVLAAVRACNEVGFIANVDFIFGMPGETDEDVHATIRIAKELAGLGARIHGHTFMPLPGTPWRNQPPGVIPSAMLDELEHLSSAGKLYGSWRKQQQVAQELTLLARRDHL